MTKAAEHFRKIVWGLVISLFDIHIMNINILPDTVGYVLVIIGLERLSAWNTNFSKAKTAALILAVCTIPDFIKFAPNLLVTTQISIWLLIYNSILTLIKAVLIYHIFTGIIQLAKDRGLEDLYQQALARWKLYAVIIGFHLITTPFQLNFLSDWQLLYIVLTLIVLIVEVTVIVLINRAGKQLSSVE